MKQNKINQNNKNVLVFTAHPDDHLLCAGTMMYLKSKGFKLIEIVFSGGEKSVWVGNNHKNIDREKLVSVRENELSEASKLIGTDEVITLRIPSGEITRTFELVAEIVKLIRKKKPAIVLCHHPDDYHHDHRVSSKIVREAVDRATWTSMPEWGKPYRTSLVLYMEGEYITNAQILVDITKYIDKKEQLFSIYKSQISKMHELMLTSKDTYRGFFLFTFGDQKVAAEAFELPSDIPIYPVIFQDLIKLFSFKA